MSAAAIRRLTDNELSSALDRIIDRDEKYVVVKALVRRDGPADVSFILAVVKEQKRREKEETPADYLDLLLKYPETTLDNYTKNSRICSTMFFISSLVKGGS